MNLISQDNVLDSQNDRLPNETSYEFKIINPHVAWNNGVRHHPSSNPVKIHEIKLSWILNAVLDFALRFGCNFKNYKFRIRDGNGEYSKRDGYLISVNTSGNLYLAVLYNNNDIENFEYDTLVEIHSSQFHHDFKTVQWICKTKKNGDQESLRIPETGHLIHRAFQLYSVLYKKWSSLALSRLNIKEFDEREALLNSL